MQSQRAYKDHGTRWPDPFPLSDIDTPGSETCTSRQPQSHYGCKCPKFSEMGPKEGVLTWVLMRNQKGKLENWLMYSPRTCLFLCCTVAGGSAQPYNTRDSEE